MHILLVRTDPWIPEKYLKRWKLYSSKYFCHLNGTPFSFTWKQNPIQTILSTNELEEFILLKVRVLNGY